MASALKASIRALLARLRGEATLARLKARGLRVGDNVDIRDGVLIDWTYAHLISIGNDVTIAPRVHIVAHDAGLLRLTGHGRLGLVTIEDHVYIGAGAIVLPGVTLGEGSIVAAGAVVASSVAPGIVVGGMPAKPIGTVEGLRAKHEVEMVGRPVFPLEWMQRAGHDHEIQRAMREALADGDGYIVGR